MSSRTSCAQRQATAILAAHSSASSREGTSTIAKPPMTSLVSGNGPSVTRAVGGDDARPLAFQPSAINPHPGVSGLVDHLERGLGHVRKVLLGEYHRPRHRTRLGTAPLCLPCLPAASRGRLHLLDGRLLRIGHTAKNLLAVARVNAVFGSRSPGEAFKPSTVALTGESTTPQGHS